MVAEPAAALEAAVRVSVLWPLPGAAMLDGEKAAVTPLGNPVAENAMAELNPLATEVVKATVADAPRATLALAAPADRVKVGGGVTVSATV